MYDIPLIRKLDFNYHQIGYINDLNDFYWGYNYEISILSLLSLIPFSCIIKYNSFSGGLVLKNQIQ